MDYEKIGRNTSMSRNNSAKELPVEASPRMFWHTLLSQDRLYPRKRTHSHHRTAFELDYDRLIFSKAFRRLARKTQVHPLAVNDHTHNRLTHSLEVASVGRSLGKAAYRIAQNRETQSIPISAIDFAELVQAACLAHDVGNTPFGHAGERAIRNWMSSHANIHVDFTDAQRSDLVLYEGNAQSFRIATRSISGFEQGCDYKHGGLGLTAATLATMMKYPWCSDHANAQTDGKYSVFQSDLSTFKWVAKTTGLLPQENAYCRHPLAFLVEAADDICNAIVDIEDAIDLHIINRDDVEQSLMQLSGMSKSSTIAEMRSTSIGKLVEQCLHVFTQHYDAIMQGQRVSSLIQGIDENLLNAFNKLNEIARNKVYPFQQDDCLEQSCITILASILNASIHGDSSMHHLESKSAISPYADFLDLVANTTASDYEQLMTMMDFIAGMTDNYAVNLAGRLTNAS